MINGVTVKQPNGHDIDIDLKKAEAVSLQELAADVRSVVIIMSSGYVHLTSMSESSAQMLKSKWRALI